MSREWPRSIALLLIAVAIPFSLAGFLIMSEHWGTLPSSALNILPWQVTVALLILPGLIPIRYLRWTPEWRIAAGLIYFLSAFCIMPLYGLFFACRFTGDCI